MRGQRIGTIAAALALLAGCSGDDSTDGGSSVAQSFRSSVTPPPNSAAEPAPPDVTAAAPPALEELSQGLFGAADVGVPEDWAVLDLDPLVAEELLSAPDADPFVGLLTCAPGTVREDSDDASWLSRRFTAPEVPRDDGLLTVELLIEIESDDEFAADVAALAECTSGEQATLETAATQLELPDETGTAGAVALTLRSPPTATVPYPSSFSAISAHHGERTVLVIFGGLDQGADWSEAARDVAGRLLVELMR